MPSLYMLPVPIAEDSLSNVLPEGTISRIRSLKHFLVENAKTARAFLKDAGHPDPISTLWIKEIGHRVDEKQMDEFLAPLREGHDVGIMSEAGCPGVADPGALIARAAQKENYRVVPEVGPCSMILALMASGLDGQHFRFCGYLPIKEPERTQTIKDLEKQSARSGGETQLFIETPYRNTGMLASLAKACHPQTLILVATDITGKHESILTKTAAEWLKLNPELPKLPTIFGMLSQQKFAPAPKKRPPRRN